MTPHNIKREVARYYSVSIESIMQHSRVPDVVRARQMAMYLCRTLKHMSFPAIGRSFKRDHSSVMQAVERVGGYESFVDDVRALTTLIVTGFNTVGPERSHRCAGCLKAIERDGVYCSKPCSESDQAWLERREVAA